jgi:hypothetical protein
MNSPECPKTRKVSICGRGSEAIGLCLLLVLLANMQSTVTPMINSARFKRGRFSSFLECSILAN